MSGGTDQRVSRLRGMFRENEDAVHAEYHLAYHKSTLKFYGLRAPLLRSCVRDVFGSVAGRLRTDIEPVIDLLWSSEYAEERTAALLLLESIADDLVPGDLVRLKNMTRDCEGWGHLDHLGVNILGRLGLNHGEDVYAEISCWSDDAWLWTRRASILVHELPARRAKLNHHFAWPTFDSLLHEREFFIRKAIGWVLRTASRHYSRQVYDFLLSAGDRASGLTRREGARNLPDELRIPLLGK